MLKKKIWYLSFLGPLGLLGFVFKQPLFDVFFGFFVFLGFYRIDERDLATLGRASLITLFVLFWGYFITAAHFLMVIARVPTNADSPLWPAWESNLMTSVGLMAFGNLGLGMVTFTVSYLYLNSRGLKS